MHRRYGGGQGWHIGPWPAIRATTWVVARARPRPDGAGPADTYSERVRLLGLLKARIERSCERLGVNYPWWIPAYSTLACVVITLIAYFQRGSLHSDPAVIAALALSVVPIFIWIGTGLILPHGIEAVITTAAVGLYLVHPVTPDFAALLLMIVVGEVAATSRLTVAVIIATLDVTVLIVAASVHHLQSAPLFVAGIVLGLDVGIALRWQMRALTAERANTAMVRQQARLDERQRIAREVHDVVGHSLSINLLHVTAARHALQQHADIADAIESLVEAEQVGRAAMGDLRRTVAVLGADGSGGPDGSVEVRPLPGLDDIPDLIERSCSAGLDVRYDCDTSGAVVGGTAGLGLYRIVQESLANVAKHAPTAEVQVALTNGPDALRLSVRNTLPTGVAPGPGDGSGLAGMAARAQQLGGVLQAGVDGEYWIVDLTVPAASV